MSKDILAFITGLVLLGLIVFFGVSFAQTTYIQPMPNGGYQINTPGQSTLPTYVNPMPNGGYIVQEPGRDSMPLPPTYIQPMPNGGYQINRPFQFGNHNDD